MRPQLLVLLFLIELSGLLSGCSPSAPTSPATVTPPAPPPPPGAPAQSGTASTPPAAVPPASASTPARKRITGQGFTLEIPSDWQAITQGEFLVIQPTQALGPTGMTISRQAILSSSTIARSIESLKKSAGLTLLSESEMSLAGKTATRVVGSNGEGERAQPDLVTYILPADDKHLIYARCAVTEPMAFAEYEKQFDAIMRTIALTP
jgi:hypothetical protein